MCADTNTHTRARALTLPHTHTHHAPRKDITVHRSHFTDGNIEVGRRSANVS